MTMPLLEPPVDDAPPLSDTLTDYDRMHLVTYLRLLDAEADGADPDEVARLVLRIDPAQEPGRARRAHAAHLARAHWMMRAGYAHLIRQGAH
ncbi:DNA -binding domain-containing protein [Azospirillum soli]|uniref:DNA -binding domain-containing protein n=1 Tax=Azospirillum soli TaxID=1304799 RepID=UPI001AEA91B9|nr:DUF2285 domain-containing protein [Azospirillum soli]MBP2310729.1 hypothetical protein [Azospirillum soli]